MSFWLVFLKTHLKKAISRQKRHFDRFLQLLTFLKCILKNTDKNNILGPVVCKAKTEKKNVKKKLVDPPKSAFTSFETEA